MTDKYSHSATFAEDLNLDLKDMSQELFMWARSMRLYAELLEEDGDAGLHASGLRNMAGALTLLGGEASRKSCEWLSYAGARQQQEQRYARS